MRYDDLGLLAPVARTAFLGLDALLRRETRFRCFETYRDPKAQTAAFATGTSKAPAFSSPHQFGLAADFVPYGSRGWVWPHVTDGEWDTLRMHCRTFGLINDLNWDRPHVYHRVWRQVRQLIRER
jgi:hypothetical protein